MTQHTLQGRTEKELLWFRRRSFLQAAAAWTSMGGFAGAQAQQRSNIVQLAGDATINGQRLESGRTIQTGDQIQTGPNSNLVFAIGSSSFLVRENSRFAVERGTTLNTVSLLRILTGAIGSVWGRGATRQVVTPTLTAGIRGTGFYTEVLPEQGYRTYFCNCYGTIDLITSGDRIVSRTDYHQSFWAETAPRNGRMLTPAGAINHSDEEMEMLARLVNQQTAWEAIGRRGIKDGKGYMDPMPPEAHPAAQPPR
jgi:hypothetical protein